MNCCVLPGSCCWRDSVVLNLDGLYISLIIVALYPLFVLYLLIALLWLIQVSLSMLGWLPVHNQEPPPPLFGLFLFSVQVVSLVNFPLCTILFLLHSLGVPICVVYVGVFLDMDVGINGGRWVHNLACMGKRLLSDHVSNLVWCQSTGHWSNQNLHGNVFLWILWDDLNVSPNVFDSKIANNQWKCDWLTTVILKYGRILELLVPVWC